MNRSHLTLGLAAAITMMIAGPALAADQWKDKGKECDDGAFKDPAGATMDDLVLCSKLWQAYRTDLKPVKGAYKDNVVAAFTRIYVKGEEAPSKRAKAVLAQLGVTDLPERNAEPPKPKTPPRQAFAPKAPTKAEITKAEAQFKNGFKAYKAKDFKKAGDFYVKMVEAAPGYAKGHFNAACAFALQKDEPNMAKYLMNLRDMSAAGDKSAVEMMKLVKTDADFADFKNESDEYKRITGYARILIVNHLAEKGEENVDNLTGSLKKLGYDVTVTDAEKKNPKKNPIIVYGEQSRVAAYIAKKLISHPKTETAATPKEKRCKDGDCYDVVIHWNDEVKGDPKKFVADPDEAEKKLDALEKEQDEILSKPEDAVDEVDDALGKPEEVQDRIEDNLERPGKAIDKAGKTLDKVKGAF